MIFLFSLIFLSKSLYADSVLVSPNSLIIENTIFSAIEEKTEEEAANSDAPSRPVLSFGLREKLSESLNYNSSESEFSFSSSVESALQQKRRVGHDIYIIQSNLNASFRGDTRSQVLGEELSFPDFESSDEPIGTLNYGFQLETKSRNNVTYKYAGYISHIDEQQTSFGLSYTVVRSKNLHLCTLDDEATLQVELIQESLELRGVYDLEVHCMFSDNIEFGQEVFFI